MKLDKLRRSVIDSLRELPYRGYLVAVGALCAELADLHAARDTAEGRALAGRTLAVLAAAAQTSPDAVRAEAREVLLDWLGLMGLSLDDPGDDLELPDLPVGPGPDELWCALRDVSGELAGELDRYETATMMQAALAAADGDGESDERLSITEGRVADERRLGVQYMVKALDAVALIAADASGSRTASEVRAAVFGR
ncbi:hypothetical protein CS0771_40710 [Catellatospora sp. IY07-71]|uniref:hypothetical protein n=1 Tax=Catellatospora sp. IY07-71 TaxID=2728827 RepID=UPI001BB37936|nr:hypothetical protein [Catellatospora sp. IY07-71]BCJ74527.1 hypothetical protein CS0771_40710 [Catellatospora sp. IY07-71]